MATITKRFNRDGAHIGWQVKVRRHGFPPKSKTFEREEPELCRYALSNLRTHLFEDYRDRAGLPHLHLHDLRHEATSRLAERDWNILELAAVTGHQDLNTLKRYTNLRAVDLAKKMDSGG